MLTPALSTACRQTESPCHDCHYRRPCKTQCITAKQKCSVLQIMAVAREVALTITHLNELRLVDAADKLDVAGKVREVWQTPRRCMSRSTSSGAVIDRHPRQLAARAA